MNISSFHGRSPLNNKPMHSANSFTSPLTLATLIFVGSCRSAPKCEGILAPPDPRIEIDTSSTEFLDRISALKSAERKLGGIARPDYLVDIHTHTFNANYLPLPEIVQARANSRVLRYLGRVLARALQQATDVPYGFGQDEVILKAEAPRSNVATRLQELIDEDAVDTNAAFSRSSGQQSVQSFIIGSDEPADQESLMSWDELKRDKRFIEGIEYLQEANRRPGRMNRKAVDAKVAASKFLAQLLDVVPFFEALGTRDVDMPSLYRSDFELGMGALDTPKKVLMVTQQGDFGAAYGGVGEGKDASGDAAHRYRDYRTVLLPATSALQERPDQDILFFGSYDPFMDGRSGLQLAYDAVMNYGAMGLKYYPPSGSRATKNEIPPLPCKKHKRAAWRSRYEEGGRKLTNQDLDLRIAEFLDWCVASDLPVFTHSNPGEFEADSCYGYTFTHPEYWRIFLESNNKRAQLRLCLGHASGPDFWFGTTNAKRPTKSWGPVAALLAMTHENVYLEMGVHDEIMKESQRHHFIAILELLEEIAEREDFPYRISDKILYGSDWFMPIDRPLPAYLDSYAKAMATLDQREGGTRWTQNFFWRNAQRYLNSECRATSGIKVASISPERPGGEVRLPASVIEDLNMLPRQAKR